MTTEPNVAEDFDEGFQGVSRSELEGMNDLALAEWQAGWNPGTAKHILAEKEWQRRLSARQLHEQFRLDSRLANATNRAMTFAAIIGVLGTLAGAVVGAYATLKAGSAQNSPSVAPPQPQATTEMPKAQSTPARAPATEASR